MRKFALAVLAISTVLPTTACSTQAAYENDNYWSSVRRRSDGRRNAYGRDLQRIMNFIDPFARINSSLR